MNSFTNTPTETAISFISRITDLFAFRIRSPLRLLPPPPAYYGPCEVAGAIPAKRNLIYIGIDERPTRVGIVRGSKCEETLLRPADILPIPAGSWLTFSGPEGAQILAVEVRDDRLLLNFQDVADLWAAVPAVALAPTVETRSLFEDLMCRLNQVVAAGGGIFREGATNGLEGVCQRIFEILSRAESIARSSHLTSGGQAFADTALHYSRANLRRKLRRPEIAEFCGISESYLTLLIRKNLGMSLTDMLAVLRACRAFEHIVGTSHKMASSAKICGFSSNNYFIRAYRNLNGLTPLQVRKHYHRSSDKTAAEQLALFRLDGFRLISPIDTPGIRTTHSPGHEIRTPLAVANATSAPIVLSPKMSDDVRVLWHDTWIPPGRSRILWSPPGTIWEAMNSRKTSVFNHFQSALDPTQTMVLPAGTRV